MSTAGRLLHPPPQHRNLARLHRSQLRGRRRACTMTSSSQAMARYSTPSCSASTLLHAVGAHRARYSATVRRMRYSAPRQRYSARWPEIWNHRDPLLRGALLGKLAPSGARGRLCARAASRRRQPPYMATRGCAIERAPGPAPIRPTLNGGADESVLTRTRAYSHGCLLARVLTRTTHPSHPVGICPFSGTSCAADRTSQQVRNLRLRNLPGLACLRRALWDFVQENVHPNIIYPPGAHRRLGSRRERSSLGVSSNGSCGDMCRITARPYKARHVCVDRNAMMLVAFSFVPYAPPPRATDLKYFQLAFC